MLGSMFVEWPHRGSWTELSCASCPQAIGMTPAITTLDFDCEHGRKKFPLVDDGFYKSKAQPTHSHTHMSMHKLTKKYELTHKKTKLE